MICENCLYNKNCQFLLKHRTADDVDECTAFEDKSEWVHLPCKIGDTVYKIGKIKCRDCDFEEDCISCGLKIRCPLKIIESRFNILMINNVGQTIFLTREEAEKTLAERIKR